MFSLRFPFVVIGLAQGAFGGANIGSVLECKFQISNSGPVNIVQQPKSRRVTIESDAEEIDFGTVSHLNHSGL